MKLTTTQLRRIIMEEVSLAKTGDKDPQRFLHGFESGHPTDDEGYMIKSRMADIKEMAETVCDLLEMDDQLPGWVQDLVASAHTDLEHVKDYLVGDEKMRSYKEQPAAPMPVGESRRRKRFSEGFDDSNALHDQLVSALRGLKALGRPLKDEVMTALSEVEPGVTLESRRRKSNKLVEGHARITQEEFAAWKSGDWGFVSEHDGGFRNPLRRSMDVIPADPDKLTDYIIRNYEGMCADLGCSDISDPEFKEYVSDQLAGKVDPMTLKLALAGL